jgi:predicted hotdog family 3-hydroxylacyl-ACP dehydratase
MEQNQRFSAEPLIPHRQGMKLIDWVKNPTQNSLQAETTVREAWPLNDAGDVNSIICVELVAQAVSALSTWRRGEGAKPRIGLLAGIKEAAFFYPAIPVTTRLTIRIEELYHVGDYAVFHGEVSSNSAVFCKTVIQAIEPEEDILSKFKTGEDVIPGEEERKW